MKKVKLAFMFFGILIGASVIIGCDGKNSRILETNVHEDVSISLDTYLSDEDARMMAEKYLNLLSASESGVQDILEVLVYPEDEIDRVVKIFEKDSSWESYKNTELSYEDFRARALKYMAENVFNELSDGSFENKNGKLYIHIPATEPHGFSSIDVKKVGVDGEKYIYKTIEEFLPSDYSLKISGATRTLEFTKNSEGKYVISDWYDYSSKIIKVDNEVDIRGFSVKRFDTNIYDTVGIIPEFECYEKVETPIVLEVGESYQLETMVNDIPTSDLLKYKIKDDEEFATVTETGLITLKSEGVGSVLVTANDMNIEIPLYSKNLFR